MKKVYFTDLDSTIIGNNIKDKYNDLICVATNYKNSTSFMRISSLENFKEIT